METAEAGVLVLDVTKVLGHNILLSSLDPLLQQVLVVGVTLYGSRGKATSIGAGRSQLRCALALQCQSNISFSPFLGLSGPQGHTHCTDGHLRPHKRNSLGVIWYQDISGAT